MTDEGKNFWGRKTLCLVTGASQGIGENLALEFSKRFGEGSSVLLLARSVEKLQQVERKIEESTTGINVRAISYDLSKPNMESLNGMLKEFKGQGYPLNILIHNAGSEGTGSLCADMSDLEEWQSYMALNLYSVAMLTSAFLETLTGGEKMLINITSLAAIKPFKGLGYYCVGKAAREMYFKTLAEEEPSVTVLNYSPGPVKTEMIDRVIKKVGDEEVRKTFESMRDDGKLVEVEETTSRLIDILTKSNFKSADRIDFFD